MKKALVVVDMQNDFIDGALGFAQASSVTQKVAKLAGEFEGDLIFTFDTHEEDYLQTKEGRNLPVTHCVKNSGGWQVAAQLQPFLQRAVKVVEKGGFGSLQLAEFCKTRI